MKRNLLLLLVVYALIVVLLARQIEAIGISGIWYIRDRLDWNNYTYNNAVVELNDPHNVQWINERVGY